MNEMLASCPECSARYRLRPEQLTEDSVRLRCRECESIFRVYSPDSPHRPSVLAKQGMRPRVVVADPDPTFGKALSDAIGQRQLEPLLVHDGVEAIMTIQRAMPHVVILAADLPGMSGSQICELMKRNASLKPIRVALLTEARGDLAEKQEFGPDTVLAREDWSEKLVYALGGLGSAEPKALDEPSVHLVAPEPAPVGTQADSGPLSQAERLARVIVSDLVLYNEAKFKSAAAAGKVYELLESEIASARAHFNSRVDTAVASQRDFLREELDRMIQSHC